MAEREISETSNYQEIARREKVKNLAKLMRGETETPKDPPEIYREELEKSVDAIIEQEAISLYKKITGKRKIPPEGPPQEFKDRALIEVLRRWQKTLKEIRETIPKTAVPSEAKYVVGAPPVCPKCGVPMEKLIGKLYQCPKCHKCMRVG